MSLRGEHDLHRRRFGRNLGLAAALAAFVAVMFGLTVSKIAGGAMMEAYDHVPRASMSAPADGQ